MVRSTRRVAPVVVLAIILTSLVSGAAIADGAPETPETSEYPAGTVVITAEGMPVSEGEVLSGYTGPQPAPSVPIEEPTFTSKIPGAVPQDRFTPSPTELDAIGSSKVIASWNDHGGRLVNARQAAVTKISTKHGVTSLGPVKLATRLPTGGTSVLSGTSRTYLSNLQWRVCNGWSCPVKASVKFKVVVDFRSVSGGTFGLVTGYCVGMTVCPTWVNNVQG